MRKSCNRFGGLQCESFYAQKQCVTVLDNVVWPQTIIGNRNQLSKPLSKEIIEKLNTQQGIDKTYQPFGDGNTAQKVIDKIKEAWLWVIKGDRVWVMNISFMKVVI